MSGPLVGVRVLDLTSVGMGPYATQILGDMGAEVIKVESAAGDAFRHSAPSLHDGMSAAWLQLNRNKRSLVLDLKAEADLALLHRLLADADILVSSIRPQAMRRLGLDPAELVHRYPRLIYCGLYGFSEAGPYAGQPAFDDIIQARSGCADLQGRSGASEPAYVNTVIADKVSGLTAAYAMAMALYERERSGCGQAIEVPMFETLVSFNLIEHMAGASFSGSGLPMGYGRVLSPFRKPYRTRDGHISVLPYTSQQWLRFFELSGHSEYARQERFTDPVQRGRHIDELYRLVADILVEHTTTEWIARLEAADIPCAPVTTLEGLLEDPHLKATGFFQTREHPSEGLVTMPGIPVGFSRTPGSIRTLAPGLDADATSVREQGWLNLRG